MVHYRSRTTTHGRNMAGARSLWRATGLKDSDFGKPIIASDLDGFKEVVNSGKNGSLFEVGNSQELAFCIEQLLCRESILKHYSDEVKSFEKTYPEYSWSYIADSFINLFIER